MRRIQNNGHASTYSRRIEANRLTGNLQGKVTEDVLLYRLTSCIKEWRLLCERLAITRGDFSF